MQSNIDSGATPIGRTDRAPDEIIEKIRKGTHVSTNLKISIEDRFVDIRQIDVLQSRRRA